MAATITPLASRILLIIMLLICTFLGTIHINSKQVPFTDELLFEEASYRMAVSGQLLTPQLQTQTWLEKPPLYFWLTAGVFRITETITPNQNILDLSASVTDNIYNYPWIRRAITVLAALGILVVIFQFTKHAWGSSTAVVSTAILLTTPQYLFTILGASLDLTATFFISASIYQYYLLVIQPKSGYYRRSLSIGILIGLSVLTRSLLALTPLAIITCHQFLVPSKRLSRTQTISLISALLIIILPWHLYQFFTHQHQFISEYLGFNFIDHAIKLTPGYAVTTPLYYIKLLIQNPLNYAVLPALYLWYRQPKKLSIAKHIHSLIHTTSPSNTALILAILWFCIPTGILSLASTRHSWYALQALPPIAILVGLCVIPAYQYLQQLPRQRLRYLFEMYLITAALVAPVVVVTFPHRSAPTVTIIQTLTEILPPDQPIFMHERPYLPNTILFHPHPTQIVTTDALISTANQHDLFYIFVGYDHDAQVLDTLPHLQTVLVYPQVGTLYRLPPKIHRL